MKKLTVLLTALLLLLGILAGCGSNSSNETASGDASSSEGEEKELTKVRLQLKWLPQTQFAGYYVADAKGYYEEEGIDIEILSGGPDIIPEQQVANGAADIGMAWVASLLSHREEGFPLVEFTQITQKSAFLLVSKKEANINSPDDLVGKKIGAWFGGLEFEILALLDKYGIDKDKDVELTKQGFTMDQILDDQIDVASALTHNEFLVLLESGLSRDDLNIIDMNEEGVAMLQDSLFATEEWLAENEDVAVRFLRATLKGWKDVINNPEEATDIVMELVDENSTTREHQLNMAIEIAKLVKPEGFDIDKIGYIDADAFKQTADIAYKFGVIKEEADLSKAYTNSIWEKATQQ